MAQILESFLFPKFPESAPLLFSCCGLFVGRGGNNGTYSGKFPFPQISRICSVVVFLLWFLCFLRGGHPLEFLKEYQNEIQIPEYQNEMQIPEFKNQSNVSRKSESLC